MKKIILIFIILICNISSLVAQITNVDLHIVDGSTKKPISLAYVVIKTSHSAFTGITDDNGLCRVRMNKKGFSTIDISHLSYNPKQILTKISADTTINVNMYVNLAAINEVYVLGKEDNQMTSATVIDRNAINMVQASSLADLLELMPGGYASDPALGGPNLIALREVDRPSDNGNYNTSSLGTSFMVDGRLVNTDANMLWMLGYNDDEDFVNAGVDMRAFGVDDAESVEIVRGIPSVKYGDLTSGLVNIIRKSSAQPLSGRMKADKNSKLFYLGKGAEIGKNGTVINASIDYIDYNPEMRTEIYGYKRITSSLRGEKLWRFNDDKESIKLNLSFDYVGSFDTENYDNEMNGGDINKFVTDYNSYATSLRFNYNNYDKSSFFRSFYLTASYDTNSDNMIRDFIVDPTNTAGFDIVTNSKKEGRADAILLRDRYLSHMETHSKPQYAYSQAYANLSLPIGIMKNDVMLGSDWRYSYNSGDGMIYDPLTPPYLGGSYRPRAFNAVPASNNLGFFIEDMITLPIGEHKLTGQLGLRANTLLGLDSRYKIANKMQFDPRVNLKWTFPSFQILGEKAKISLLAGAGKHSKAPTLDYLYPELEYNDFIELKYLSNYNYRYLERCVYRTYIEDRTNYDLGYASNNKQELRIDVDYAGCNFSVVYYNEDMLSGFRSVSSYKSYSYNRYKNKSFTIEQMASFPKDKIALSLWKKNEITEKHSFATIYSTENGSQTYKNGIEYSFDTPRFEAIATRLMIRGAYAYTSYTNTVPLYQMADGIIGDEPLEFIGVYNDDTSYIRWMHNTNFYFDTWLPNIGLGVLSSFQCFWNQFSSHASSASAPTHYIGHDNVVREFTPAALKETPGLGLLLRDKSTPFDTRTPFSMYVNLKITKKLFKEKLNVSMYVNRLFDYAKTYKLSNQTIYRNIDAYFGMEITMAI